MCVLWDAYEDWQWDIMGLKDGPEILVQDSC